MKISRRELVAGAGAMLMAGVAADVAHAQKPATSAAASERSPEPPSDHGAATKRGYTPVHTPNGWTLPARVVDGVKEFHLVAEEIEHEFAPGCKAKCWGYNGSTPGPTIELVEGDTVRFFVTNRLPEHTSMHWHGIMLPNGMDGVGGLTQPQIKPGETYVYEFTLRQHGTFMYHPHADEMVQMAVGMMGLLVIHPKDGEVEPVDRDFAILLHNWALHPGTYRPDPSVLLDFDLYTFNSKVFPAIEYLVARSGERVRIRFANLSMWNHPMHMHGAQFEVTGGDGGRWPKSQWRREVTEIVGVGQTRDLEFIAAPGDWTLHCHMAHHTMNAMGHDIPNPLGVDQSELEDKVRELLPGFIAMGEAGMAEHQEHTEMGHHRGPANTLPMMMGRGPYGNLEMGGMFTLIKVRDDIAPGDYRDPGWFKAPRNTMAKCVSRDPDFGKPIRRT